MANNLYTTCYSPSGAITVVILSIVLQSASADDLKDQTVDFERNIRPIFTDHCTSCHGAKRQEGGLRLDNRADALRGGDSGKSIVAGGVDVSLLMQRVTSTDASLRMPLDEAALAVSEVKLLKRWLETGAEWPTDKAKARVVSDHWSFQPIRRPDVPTISATKWVRNPIDAFVLRRLNDVHLAPSPTADPVKLVRRLHLDLIGLPPEPAAVDDFLSDGRPDAYQRLVDRLLASPHFGERWGQVWLDLARYADSDGYEMDYARPNAWRWRDWVIDAINKDLPFDQFTVDQIAGDLIPHANAQQRLATGFHRNTPTNTENGIDSEEFRVKAVVDRVNTTGTVWLGLTIGCAECHSHKYDPLRQQEYYGLFAFFNERVDEAEIAVEPTSYDRSGFTTEQSRYEATLRRLETELKSAEPGSRSKIEERLQKLRESPPRLTSVAQVFRSRAQPRQTFVHRRGNFLDRGQRVSADIPQVLPPLADSESPHDRLDFAHWLVDARNPLTARVEANRLWQHLFGFGLVRTPDDFGTHGEPPTHGELLDWLASELQQRSWSRKQMIRQIVTSATYRQDSELRPDVSEMDPENRLLARQNRYRLDAELVRDQSLAAGSLLSRRIGGPSFYPPLPTGLSQLGFRVDWRADPPAEQRRRGIYLVVRRNLAYPMLTTFDRPDANITCVRRERSNTPMQALTQLNDPLVVDCAVALATRLINRHRSRTTSDARTVTSDVRTVTSDVRTVTAGPAGNSGPAENNVRKRIEHAFRLCLARRPVENEARSLKLLYERLLKVYEADPKAAATLLGDDRDRIEGDLTEFAAWTVLARTIMNLDEFVTRE